MSDEMTLRGGRLLALAVLLVLSGCASTSRQDAAARAAAYRALIEAPTPAEWRPGETWRLRRFDADGAVTSEELLRLTDRPIDTCQNGEWMALEPLVPRRRPVREGVPLPEMHWAYQVKGRHLELDPTGWCDLEMINGALDGARFEGTTSGGPFAGRRYQPLRVEAEHVPAPSPAAPLADGEHVFRLRSAEHPAMPRPEVIVLVRDMHITVRHPAGSPEGTASIAEGTLTWHAASRRWVIAREPADAEADEVGGCTGGPVAVDPEAREIEVC